MIDGTRVKLVFFAVALVLIVALVVLLVYQHISTGGDRAEEPRQVETAADDRVDEPRTQKIGDGAIRASVQGYGIEVADALVTTRLTLENSDDGARRFEISLPVVDPWDSEWVGGTSWEYTEVYAGTETIDELEDYPLDEVEVSSDGDVQSWEVRLRDIDDGSPGHKRGIIVDVEVVVEAGEQIDLSIQWPAVFWKYQVRRIAQRSEFRTSRFLEVNGVVVAPSGGIAICEDGFGQFVSRFGRSQSYWDADNPRQCPRIDISQEGTSLDWRISDGCFVRAFSQQSAGANEEPPRPYASLRRDEGGQCDELGTTPIRYGEPTGGVRPGPPEMIYEAWCDPPVGESLPVYLDELRDTPMTSYVYPAMDLLDVDGARLGGESFDEESWSAVAPHLRYWHKAQLMRYLRAYLEARREGEIDGLYLRQCLAEVEPLEESEMEDKADDLEEAIALLGEYHEEYTSQFEAAFEDVTPKRADLDLLEIPSGTSGRRHGIPVSKMDELEHSDDGGPLLRELDIDVEEGLVSVEFALSHSSDDEGGDVPEVTVAVPIFTAEWNRRLEPGYTSFTVGSSGGIDFPADDVVDEVSFSVDGGSGEWAIRVLDPQENPYGDVVGGAIVAEGVLSFDGDGPLTVVVEYPAIISRETLEMDSPRTDLEVFPYVEIDSQVQIAPGEVRLCVPGFSDFASEHGTSIVAWDETYCTEHRLRAAPATVAWQIDGQKRCFVETVDPGGVEDGKERLSARLTWIEDAPCLAPGLRETGYWGEAAPSRYEDWCSPLIWEELEIDVDAPLDEDFLEAYVFPAMDRFEGIGPESYDEKSWQTLQPYLRNLHTRDVLKYLQGYLRVLRGEELEDRQLRRCFADVEARPGEVDSEVLDENIETLSEWIAHFDERFQKASRRALSGPEIDIPGWD